MLLSSYASVAGQTKAEAMVKKVAARGVNIERMMASLQQQEQ